MGILDAREAGAVIYSLANGVGKQRPGRDGANAGIRANPKVEQGHSRALVPRAS
jgi:hypothetical protein